MRSAIAGWDEKCPTAGPDRTCRIRVYDFTCKSPDLLDRGALDDGIPVCTYGSDKICRCDIIKVKFHIQPLRPSK